VRFLAGASAARPIGFGLRAREMAGQAEMGYFGPAIDPDSQPESPKSAISVDVEVAVAVQTRIELLALRQRVGASAQTAARAPARLSANHFR